MKTVCPLHLCCLRKKGGAYELLGLSVVAENSISPAPLLLRGGGT